MLFSPLAVAEGLEDVPVGLQNPTEPSPAVLYFHFLDRGALLDFPVTTQVPDGFARDSYDAPAMQSTGCLRSPLGGATGESYHSFYGYSSPSYVDYAAENEPRAHWRPGMADDVHLSTESPAALTWFMETTAVPGVTDVTVPVPEVKVRATIRAGNGPNLGPDGFNHGDLVAEGELGPFFLGAGGAPPSHDVDGRTVYEFQLPLEFQRGVLGQEQGFNVRVDVWIDADPACSGPGQHEDDYLMPNLLRPHASPELLPRLEWSVLNPIGIEYIRPQFIGEDLVILTSMNSPWGSYDVDEQPGGITVAVDGPTPAASLRQVAVAQRHHGHFSYGDPVDVTYVWPYLLDGAADGVYQVHVEVWNDQRTAKATGTAAFEVGRNVGLTDSALVLAAVDGQDAAGLPLAVCLGALVALAGRRRLL